MTVLKDAASTSLYGSRAANGVIVITTKKGRLNQAPQVSFRASAGISDLAVDLHDLESTDNFTEYSWEALRNGYIDSGADLASANQLATDNLVPNLGYNPYSNVNPVGIDGKLLSTDKKWDTNWSDDLINNSATRQEYALNVAGGSDNTSYMFSSNYLDHGLNS